MWGGLRGSGGQRSFTDLELRNFIVCPASCHSDFCPLEEHHPWLMSESRVCHLKDFRKTANGAGFMLIFWQHSCLALTCYRADSIFHWPFIRGITGQKDIKSYFKWVQDDLRLDKCMWEDRPIWQSPIHPCEINLKGTVDCISFNVDGGCQNWQNNLALVLYCVGKQSACLYMWMSLPLLQHVVWQEKLMACWYNWAFFDTLIRLFSHLVIPTKCMFPYHAAEES